MVDQKLIDILVCPETRLPLRLADNELVDNINRMIDEGKIKNRSGVALEKKIQGGLVTKEKSKYLYPVIEDIPILLIEESIPLDQV